MINVYHQIGLTTYFLIKITLGKLLKKLIFQIKKKLNVLVLYTVYVYFTTVQMINKIV